MTHTPPVPAGNQSPYPLQAPPHPQRDAAMAATDRQVGSRLALGAAVAVGAVAAAALSWWALGIHPKRRNDKRDRR